MEDTLSLLGQTIKKARQLHNLTQEELSARVGVTNRYITALENENKHPSVDVLCRIIHTLAISADSIFYPERVYAENEKEQLIRLISLCDERDLKVVIATVKALVESE